MCFNNGSKDWQYFARDILGDRRFLTRAVGVRPHAGVVVLEDAVVGPHAGGSIAASESAISEGRFQTDLLWTSLGCQWTAFVLRVLLRYLPFHYGGTEGI